MSYILCHSSTEKVNQRPTLPNFPGCKPDVGAVVWELRPTGPSTILTLQPFLSFLEAVLLSFLIFAFQRFLQIPDMLMLFFFLVVLYTHFLLISKGTCVKTIANLCSAHKGWFSALFLGNPVHLPSSREIPTGHPLDPRGQEAHISLQGTALWFGL